MNRHQPSQEVIREIRQALRNLSGNTRYKRFRLRQLRWLLSSCLITQYLRQHPLEPINQALKSVLSNILHELEKENPRQAWLLRWRFWEEISVKQVLYGEVTPAYTKPFTSERQYYYFQEQALGSFVSIAWQIEEACNKDAEQNNRPKQPSDSTNSQLISNTSEKLIPNAKVFGLPTTYLSDLQVRSLRLLSWGYTAREIAMELGYSTKYIEHTLAEAREMLSARNTTHLVALAKDLGLI